MHVLTTDVLIVGGGTGGTAAALQAARQGAQTILVSEFSWLGGMLTSAGVTAPDGNELAAFQTGIWGEFLRELERRQPEGLNHGWVSFFTYDSRVGAQIFADWVKELPTLQWIAGYVPLEVSRETDRITGVSFSDFTVQAKIIIDGTELGDLLELAAIPHRWGWELQSTWHEPSAPIAPTPLTQRYPVQSPTWVVVLQDFGAGAVAPEIPAPPTHDPSRFRVAWEAHGAEHFLNYGRLPGDRFMINWPHQGNDYGERADRLIQSPADRLEFLQESRWHSQGFARFIQTEIDRRYGLATPIFPTEPTKNLGSGLGGGAYALHPYYRESRRLQGLVTVREQDILPFLGGQVATLPTDADRATSIALGNYANDHHYPGHELNLKPKSLRWGGRWTGTPFTIPYGALIPATTDGFLVCEKNSSISHIANGATRLQPIVLGIGQAAGMAAALCIDRNCQPRELPISVLQEALLQDPIAPAALVPLFNLSPTHPDWLHWQRYYLSHPEDYPITGNCPLPQKFLCQSSQKLSASLPEFMGVFNLQSEQHYTLLVSQPASLQGQSVTLVTLQPEIEEVFQTLVNAQTLKIWGTLNRSGNWLLVEKIEPQSNTVINDQ